MIVAEQASPYEATDEVGIAGLVGTISMQVVDNEGNVVTAASTANIIELDLPVPTGTYAAQRTSPATIGQFTIQWSRDGTFNPATIATEDLVVVTGTVSPNLPPIPSGPGGGPLSGPCISWVDSEEVAECCNVSVGTATGLFDNAAAISSQMLYLFSGKRYAGSCETTARPCRTGCSCWTLDWVVSRYSWGAGLSWGYWPNVGWGWGGEGGMDTCGCGPLSRVLLSGYPVSAINSVIVNGDVLDPSEYRLDGWKWLTRMADADGNPQFWPACQNLALGDSDDGAWAVTYTYGQDPPLLGIEAAKQLACEVYRVCSIGSGDGDCALPTDVVRVVRQGVTFEKPAFRDWAFGRGGWRTGLFFVDAFLNATNPSGLKRRPTIAAPGGPQYARILGS